MTRFVLIFLFLTLSGIAAANQPDIGAFEEHLRNAAEALEAEQLEEALFALQSAAEIIDHPRIRLQIAQIHRDLGSCAQARRTLDRAERMELDDALREALRAQRQDLDRCEPLGRVFFQCDPEFASLQRNEDHLACQTELKLPVGTHQVVASADGYDQRVFNIRVEEDRITRETIRLSTGEFPQPPPPETPNYMLWGSVATVAVGAGLIVGGFVDDHLIQTRRTQNLRLANDNGDDVRLAELEAEYAKAPVRPIVLISAGSALVVSGAVMWFFFGREKKNQKDPVVSLGLTPEGVSIFGTF